jgi:hypothetical protein
MLLASGCGRGLRLRTTAGRTPYPHTLLACRQGLSRWAIAFGLSPAWWQRVQQALPGASLVAACTAGPPGGQSQPGGSVHSRLEGPLATGVCWIGERDCTPADCAGVALWCSSSQLPFP